MLALTALEWVVFALLAYTATVSLAGFLPRRSVRRARPLWRFAILIPAHDEARVIAHAVRAARGLDYPRRLLRIVVVADDCGDDTAERARGAGADVVYERREPARRGKGHAVRFAVERVAREWRPDAICVFDADNVMRPDFLLAMNDRLSAGAQVVQGYLDTKNPDDSWVTKASAAGYAASARLFQRSRDRLGFSASLGGTGWCVRTSTLLQSPPDPSCLVDDTELQMRLLSRGVRVAWAGEAVTFDEKPLTLAASRAQRLRWMQGRWDVARRHALALVARAFRRGELAALDGAITAVMPSRSAVAVVSLGLVAARVALAALGLAAWTGVPLVAWGALFAALAALPPAALLADGHPPRFALRYAYTVLFNWTWLPFVVLGLARSRRTEWVATRHTRGISLEARLAARTSRHPKAAVVAARPRPHSPRNAPAAGTADGGRRERC